MALRNMATIVGAGAALLLGACGHEAAQQARLDTPAAADTDVLTLTDDGANAKLASVDSGLMLECEHGGRLVHLTHVGGAGPLTLASAGVRSTVAAETQAFEGRRLLLADAPTDTPALKAFRRSAALQIDAGGATRTVTTPEAERFFAACEART